MATRRQSEPYRPNPEQLPLFPDISGNTINGLGEMSVRNPTPIYWHRPERLAHGALQQWMIKRFLAEPDLANVHQRFGGRGPGKLDPISETPENAAPDEWASRAKAFALAHESDLAGIAAVDPVWVFDGYDVAEPWIIVLGVAMDHVNLATAPANPAGLEVQAQYNRGTRAARTLANWIRGRGYRADAHGGPWAGPLTLIPAALACGFGELGKHGSIINRQYGSSFRLAAVTTDMPLVADTVDEFGAADFCSSCRVCVDACPPGAISHEQATVRGTKKWYVDFDRCIPYFNDTLGCAICIAVCPWSRPGVAPRLAERMTRRRERNRVMHQD